MFWGYLTPVFHSIDIEYYLLSKLGPTSSKVMANIQFLLHKGLYSKTREKRPLKHRQNKDFNDKW